MSTEGGRVAVVAALLANLGIAASKFVAFAFTGSSAMLAEAVHSVADTGNQGLLLFGRRRAGRAPDPLHPFGHGMERYFYGFVVALVLFSLGSMFALFEGYQKVASPHHVEDPLVAFVVLGLAILLEGFSLRTAIRESLRDKGTASWAAFVRHAKAPELPVVLLEDVAALIGLVFALLGVGLTTLTGDPIWDGIGTCAIGALLVTVAVVLVIETKSLLLGESAAPVQVRAIEKALVGDGVDRVIHLRTMHLGPEELLVGAKLAMPPAASLAQVASAIDAAEKRVRIAVPTARVIYLEPDLDRGSAS